MSLFLAEPEILATDGFTTPYSCCTLLAPWAVGLENPGVSLTLIILFRTAIGRMARRNMEIATTHLRNVNRLFLIAVYLLDFGYSEVRSET